MAIYCIEFHLLIHIYTTTKKGKRGETAQQNFPKFRVSTRRQGTTSVGRSQETKKDEGEKNQKQRKTNKKETEKIIFYICVIQNYIRNTHHQQIFFNII